MKKHTLSKKAVLAAGVPFQKQTAPAGVAWCAHSQPCAPAVSGTDTPLGLAVLSACKGEPGAGKWQQVGRAGKRGAALQLLCTQLIATAAVQGDLRYLGRAAGEGGLPEGAVHVITQPKGSHFSEVSPHTTVIFCLWG